MHRAALQGLKMVGNKLSAKRRRHTAIKEFTNQGHHAITTVLGTEAKVDDLERHHQGDTTVQSIKEPKDPELPTKHMTTKTTKRRWGVMLYPEGSHHASTQRFQTTP
jgi:hypothetical protein